MKTSTSVVESTNKQDGRDADPFFINRDGTWFYHGSPILRKSLVKLFASVLKREEDGTFWLETPSERVAVSVVDAPLIVVEANQVGISPNQNLQLRTNTDEDIIVDLEHPIYVKTNPDTGEPAPYAVIRNGLTGLITRSVFYDLVLWSEEDPNTGEYFVRSMDEKFVLGSLSTDYRSIDA
jgi:hypothetical protein